MADIRLKQLSYSSRLTLHSCPRKYQLYKLGHSPAAEEDIAQSVTFAYGHAVGAGIQEWITSHSEIRTILAVILAWDAPFLADDLKRGKSIWTAIAAVQRFISMCQNGFMRDWNLVTWQGKPATELSFIVTMPNGYTYKGYVDAVLQNEETDEVLVLELKTTSSNWVSPATYKNSAQAIGYSIILDSLFPALSSYEVLYLVYKTKAAEYEAMQFPKSYLQRALWIQELLLDTQMIDLYESTGVYPMHGEACLAFNRECEYFQTCTLSTDTLHTPLTEEDKAVIEDHSAFSVVLTLDDLIRAQLAKD
jgi:hypothetical protein